MDGDFDPSGSGFDLSRPNVARLYDYLLGGKSHFAVDRALGDQILATLPEVQVGVRAQRAVLGRVALLRGLELVPPGLVPVPEWRPDPGMPLRADYGPILELACAGVARKP